MKTPSSDLLYGVPAIAEHLQITRAKIYHLHNLGHLPTFKMGGKVCATRSGLAEHFRQLQRGDLRTATSRKAAENRAKSPDPETPVAHERAADGERR